MTGARRLSVRVLVAGVIAAGSAACAAHATPATPGPLPFPMPASPSTLRPAPAVVTTRPVLRTDVLDTALAYRGVPYRFGGADPASGFDCSGFIQFVLGAHSVTVPRTAAEQFQIGRRVGARDVQPGDLVFFSTVAPGASHVGMALNADEFVHAPAASGVVRVERLHSSYWQSRFVGARRLFSE